MQIGYNSTTEVGMWVEFGQKNIYLSVIHLWSQRSRKGQPGVNLSSNMQMS